MHVELCARAGVSPVSPVKAGEKHGLTGSRMQLSPLLKESTADTEEPDHKWFSAQMGAGRDRSLKSSPKPVLGDHQATSKSQSFFIKPP